MKKSETIKELAEAINKAQMEMSGAKKTMKNSFFKSNYANLEEVIQCIKEPFANNGLSFSQFPITEDGFAGVETVLMHKSGEWICGEFLLKCSKNDPQGMGSAITYARRYGLQSIAGVPSEDDDGNAATQPQAAKQPAKKAAKKASKQAADYGERKGITPQQTENLRLLYKSSGIDFEQYGAEVRQASGGLTDITSNLSDLQAAKLIKSLTQIIEAKPKK